MTEPAGIDPMRQYMDYMALPAAQREAIDAARDLRAMQLRALVTLCDDPDIVTMTATYMLSSTSVDGIAVRICDGPKMHCADIDRDGDGHIQVTVTLDGEWPYQRPIAGNA